MRARFLTVGVLALATAIMISGCSTVRGSGQIVTEERSISEVNRVELASIGRLEITQGSPAKLTVQADDNLMKYITTEVKGNRLVISVKPSGIPLVTIDPSQTIVYKLQLPEPTAIGLSGSGEVVADALDVPEFNVNISGSGKAAITDLRSDSFSYELSGSGKAETTGEVDHEDVNISGSGRLTAGDLKASSASISISGSGDATVWAVDRLNVSISGSGTVKYYGSPNISEQVSGSGNLRGLGPK
jgi:predicted small secreted protein